MLTGENLPAIGYTARPTRQTPFLANLKAGVWVMGASTRSRSRWMISHGYPVGGECSVLSTNTRDPEPDKEGIGVVRHRATIDILLRVHAEESRALGVSGLQPCFCHFTGVRLTQPSWSAADRRCQTAVTPILSVVDSHLLFLPAGSR